MQKEKKLICKNYERISDLKIDLQEQKVAII